MQPVRLLLIEDDHAILHMLTEFLSNALAVEIEQALSVPSAIEKVSTSKAFDLIVSDFRIPPHTAHDFEQHLRDIGHSTPLIVHSSQPGIDQSRFRQDAFVALVPKPGHRDLVDFILRLFPRAKK